MTEATAAPPAANSPKAPLVPVKKPDRSEMQKQVDAIMAEINTLQEKAKEAKAASDKIINDRSGSKGEVDAARNIMKQLIAERNQVMAQRQEITNQRDASKDKLTALINNEKSMRAELKFGSIEAIDSQIKELEQRQARTTMSLNDEKKIIKDIHNLQMSKKTVGAISELKATIEREKASRLEFDRRITEKNIELKAINDRITPQRAILDTLNKETVDSRDAIPALRKTQTECREAAQEKFQAIRNIKTEFKKSEEAYTVYINELNARKREARQKELEARAAEIEARKKQLEEEELKRTPYEEEKLLCDNLVTYLKGFQEKESNDNSSTDTLSVPTTVFAGMKLLVKEDEDYVQASKKVKGKKKGGKNGSKKDAISHSMDTLDSFAFLGITPPASGAQVAETIDLINQKKTVYETTPRGELPTLADQNKARQSVNASHSSAKARDFVLEVDFPSLHTAKANTTEEVSES